MSDIEVLEGKMKNAHEVMSGLLKFWEFAMIGLRVTMHSMALV